MAAMIRSKTPVNRITSTSFRVGEYEAALLQAFSKDNVPGSESSAERVVAPISSTLQRDQISIDRPNISASMDERDVFGTQQQAALERHEHQIYARRFRGFLVLKPARQHTSRARNL